MRMAHAKRSLALIISLLLSTTVAAAQDDSAFLKSEEIRAAYNEASQHWLPSPTLLANAFVSAEDKNFFQRSASRSTLTRTIGNWYPDGQFVDSTPLTIALAQALDHDEILDWILHKVFLGQSCFGVDGASGAYFGKAAADLSLAEAAYLAILPKGPSLFHPVRNHERALERRNWVLKSMSEQGFASAAEAEAAISAPLGVLIPLASCPDAQK